MVGPSDEVESTKGFGVVGHALEGLGSGNRRHASVDALLPTHLMIKIMLKC